MSGKRIQKKWKGMAGGVLSVLLTGSLFLTGGTVLAMDDPELRGGNKRSVLCLRSSGCV